jgi:hypothetical protein
MRVPLLVLAAVMILAGNVLITAVARSIPLDFAAGRWEWACAAGLLIAAGVGLVLWINLRRVA